MLAHHCEGNDIISGQLGLKLLFMLYGWTLVFTVTVGEVPVLNTHGESNRAAGYMRIAITAP